MLRDEAEITVRSGKGGDGCASFRREKYIPEGGPDGGDGGRGGHVIAVATTHLNTLSTYVRKRHWKARNGQPGRGRRCFGAAGDDLLLEMPCGTIIRDADSDAVIADLTEHGQQVVLAAGGAGGRGNDRFKTATNQAPRQFEQGQPGVELRLKLELKLIADVGLLGFPNAGKSTLLSRISEARPKIAAYPFTTLEPQLGVIERGDRSIVVADIPGLLEGAAEGHGLGHQFLRHIERCAMLLHVVDGSEGGAGDLAERIATLDRELARFSPRLAGKDQIIVLNKLDARPDLPATAAELAALLGKPVHCISGVSGAGIDDLIAQLLSAVPEPS